jgi:alkylhydroperoxidase family enzyme
MTPRIPRAEVPADIRAAMIAQLGAVPEPVEVLWHHPRIAQDNQELSARAAAWDAADAGLKTLTHMVVAARIGCGWCLDVNYFLALNQKLDAAKAGQVPGWRTSDAFTPLERDVFAYAEAMSSTPPAVTDEMSAGLLDRLGPAALVELTVYIGFANMAARTNIAHGITSQGFAAACGLPPMTAPETPAPASEGPAPASASEAPAPAPASEGPASAPASEAPAPAPASEGPAPASGREAPAPASASEGPASASASEAPASASASEAPASASAPAVVSPA